MSSDDVKYVSQYAQRFEKCNEIQDGYIPYEMNELLKRSLDSQETQKRLAEDIATWDSITKCICHALESQSAGWKRFLNGMVMLARNLACVPGSASLAWTSSSTGQAACDLLIKLLGISEVDLTDRDNRLISSCLQFLGNLACVDAPVFIYLAPNLTDKVAVRNLCRLVATSKSGVPVLKMYGEDPTLDGCGYTVCLEILTHTERWFANGSDDLYPHFLNRLASRVLSTGQAPQFLAAFEEPEDQHLSLLKLLDAVLPVVESVDVTSLVDTYSRQLDLTKSRAIPFITATVDKRAGYTDAELVTVANTWNALVVVLDSMMCLVERGASYKVDPIVDLLVLAHKHLPQRSKLVDMKEKGAHEPEPKDFPTVKTKLIALVTELCKKDRAVQDQVRDRGGLAVVLSNCIIDLNNPYIKEQAIVCIKYLLAQNQQNQQLVAQLEAKQEHTEQAVRQAGYETEMVDGKLALKKSKQ